GESAGVAGCDAPQPGGKDFAADTPRRWGTGGSVSELDRGLPHRRRRGKIGADEHTSPADRECSHDRSAARPPDLRWCHRLWAPAAGDLVGRSACVAAPIATESHGDCPQERPPHIPRPALPNPPGNTTGAIGSALDPDPAPPPNNPLA